MSLCRKCEPGFTRLARINSIVSIVLNNLITTSYITMLGIRISHTAHCFCSSSETYLLKKNSKPQHTYAKRNQMFKRNRKASQSPIPS